MFHRVLWEEAKGERCAQHTQEALGLPQEEIRLGMMLTTLKALCVGFLLAGDNYSYSQGKQ